MQGVGYNQQPVQAYQYLQSLQQPQPQVQNNGIQWVQGVEGAKAYQLPPNSNVILMNSEDSIFYIKSTDNVGMATLKAFKFEEITETSQVNSQKSDYVTRCEFNKLKDDIVAYVASFMGTNMNTVQQTKESGVQSYEPIT